MFALQWPALRTHVCFVIHRKLDFWEDQYCDMINGTGVDPLLPQSRHAERVLTLCPPFHRCFVIPSLRGQVEAPLLLLLGHLQVKTSAALWRQLVTAAEQ